MGMNNDERASNNTCFCPEVAPNNPNIINHVHLHQDTIIYVCASSGNRRQLRKSNKSKPSTWSNLWTNPNQKHHHFFHIHGSPAPRRNLQTAHWMEQVEVLKPWLWEHLSSEVGRLLWYLLGVGSAVLRLSDLSAASHKTTNTSLA